MTRQKSFSYIIRASQAGPELLVFDSLEEPGLEVPKGSAQPGETPAQAAVREVWEESGVTELALIKELGVTRWQDEEQHFFLLQNLVEDRRVLLLRYHTPTSQLREPRKAHRMQTWKTTLQYCLRF